MAKKVTRTDTVYRVITENGETIDFATTKEALEAVKNGNTYVGEVKVKREMDMYTWLANSEIAKEEV